MVDFLFSLNDNSNLVSGFDLGNIEIISDNMIVSSSGRKPDQSMMVFLTIVDLLDGLGKLLDEKKNMNFKLICADSSFTVLFNKINGKIKIIVEDQTICDVEPNELAKQVFNSCNSFFEKNKDKILSSDPVVGDIKAALSSFRKLLLREL
jgi:hypothetical protein